MASPEELQLEQKSRTLKLKEEALNKQAEQQVKTEARIKEHQKSVAEKERANQLKSQSLIDRESKYQEESFLLNQERQSLLDAQQAAQRVRQKPFVLLMPFLLFACIVAGYFSYEQLNTKEHYFEQVTVAAENIDKLAGLLSSSQHDVLAASNALKKKQQELVKTRAMLADLRTTTDQLQLEVKQLKSSQGPTGSEQLSLASSVVTLSDQLAVLKAQLEEYYLTNDVNEAFIEYQEKDLSSVKAQQQNLQVAIVNKEKMLLAQNTKTAQLSSSLEKMTNQYLALEARNKELENQNAQLAAKRDRFK
ncbi:MAG: hypothetical protein ACI9T9_000143 [Oleiphilaceae bacterium]|jgi:hypothetical protein